MALLIGSSWATRVPQSSMAASFVSFHASLPTTSLRSREVSSRQSSMTASQIVM